MLSWFRKYREVKIYLALAVFSAIIIGTMLFALRSATELHDTLYPLADATMELAIEASLAHLYIEQALAKNDTTELNKAWYHLDRLDEYTLVMLEGGTIDELNFRPVGNAELRHKVTYVRVVIMQYRTTTLELTAVDPMSDKGTVTRAVHETLFKELLERTAETEAQFRLQMAQDVANFKHLQVLLIAVCLVFSVLAAITFHRYMADRKRGEQRITHLNLVLRAIRNVNHLITVEEDRYLLIKKTCDLLVETRGFHNAWITLLGGNGDPAAHAEAGLGTNFSLARDYLDRGKLLPCCQMLNTTEGVLVIEDPPAECSSCPLSRMYTGRGGLAARLEHDNTLYGYMVVSSPKVFVTDMEERSLFEEVANDIALSLHLLAVDKERIRVERALRESETRYRLVTDNATDVIWAVDKDLRFTYISPSVSRCIGFGVEEAMAKKPEEMVTPDSIHLARQMFAEELTTDYLLQPNAPKSRMIELNLICKDSSTVWTESNISPLQDSSGRIIGILGVTREISERKNAAEALAESERKFRTLAEGSEQAIYRTSLVDPSDVYINPAVERIYGYSVDEWCESPDMWIKRIHPDDRDWVTGRYEVSLKETVSKSAEYRIIARDGTVRWIEDRIGFEKDEGGNAIAVSGIVTDITQRKQAGEELRKTTELLQSIMDSSTEECIIATDAVGTVLGWNEGAKRLFGYEVEELVGVKDVRDLYPQELQSTGRIEKGIAHMKDTGESLTSEIPCVAKDGRIFPAHQIITPRFDEDGMCIGFLGLLRDISSAKEAEETLRASEQRFHDIALSSADWIWETDASNRYVFTSGKVEQLLGYKPEELIGTTPFDLMPEQEVHRVSAILSEAAASKKPIVNLESFNIGKDGSGVYLLSNGVPILSESGDLVGYRGVTRDITSQKRAREEIFRYTAELENANLELTENTGELEEFIYTVSHDLKAPVVSISGFAGLIKQRSQGQIDQTTARYLERIAANAEVMERLIVDLLELSRVGRTDEEKVVVNVNDLLNEVFESFSVLATEKNVSLIIVGSPPDVYGWHDRIRQLFANLIDNAVKYMPSGADGVVRVGFDPGIQNPRGGAGAFFVADNGEGIPREFHQRIFRAFQRIRSERDQAGGSGVGLSIVNRIAEAHSGNVWLESEIGKGATFYFSLPLESEDESTGSGATDQELEETPREVL